MSKELEKLMNSSLLNLEISPNTKTSVVISDLNHLVTNIKKICSKKDVIVLVMPR
jgi:anionic cell wall polymer biosynthesis LytR-Cps2A-Psr (LCP) family protein